MSRDDYEALVRNGVVKTGTFTLKSGHTSPIYIDFRHVQSIPELNAMIMKLLCATIDTMRDKFDALCGVPIGASHYASVAAYISNIPALTYRKDVKAYGTKKVIEGMYTPGQRVLLIEDVVTTGGSIIQAAEAIRKEGLIVTDAVVLLDRTQGARENLKVKGIEMKSLFSMTELLNFLVESGKMTKEEAEIVRSTLTSMVVSSPTDDKDNAVPSLSHTLNKLLNVHPVTRYLMDTIVTKHSNVCVALDFKTHEEIAKVAALLAPHVCMIKVHADFIRDFSIDEMRKLRAMLDTHKCLLMEDRKLSDTGTTVRDQLCGTFAPTEWANLITCHATPGHAVFDGAAHLPRLSNGDCALIVVTELSTEGSLITPEYTKAATALGRANSHIVAGFVCQQRCSDDDRMIFLTPGVNLSSEIKGDNMGQQFRTPKHAVQEQRNDVIIVGRGITSAPTPDEMIARCLRFKEEAWAALEARNGA